MTEPVPNLPLLRKILDQVDAHPETWSQTVWGIQRQVEGAACGTAFCIAGHAAMMTGAEPFWDKRGGGGGTWVLNLVRDADGQPWEVDAYARAQLGLTEDEASCYRGLFDPGNTRERVQEIAEQIAERAGETL